MDYMDYIDLKGQKPRCLVGTLNETSNTITYVYVVNNVIVTPEIWFRCMIIELLWDICVK